MTMKKLLFSLLFIATFAACSDDDTPTPTPGDKEVKMIVVNEGAWDKGLGALSVIYDDGSCDYDIFRDINHRPIGDVTQSIACINGHYFVTVNNSGKVEVVNPETFLSEATIQEISSPKFIQAINTAEAIVSSTDNLLVKINTTTFEKVEEITIHSAIEQMAFANNKLFGQSNGKIVVFDADNITQAGARLVAGIRNASKTTKLVTDKNGMLWVYGSDNDKVTLHQVDPATEKLVRTYEIPFVPTDDEHFGEGSITGAFMSEWGEDFNRMDTDRTGGKLYFVLKNCKGLIYGGFQEQMAVYTFDIDTKEHAMYRALPGLSMMYGMGISPDGDVYLCDCLDYTAQRGYLREYKADGTVISTYVGVYPTMVYFTE